MTTVAAVDRLVHRSVILGFDVASDKEKKEEKEIEKEKEEAEGDAVEV